MPSTSTLAAGVMAALVASVLFAQGQDELAHFNYPGAPAGKNQPNAGPAAKTQPERKAQDSDPVPVPQVMHFCAQHCATFTLQNGRYVRSSGGVNNGSFTVMTIEKFTRESVIIHRTDTGPFPGTNLYAGRMSDDSSSLTGAGWKITWGAALFDLPGSDEERAMRQGVSPDGQNSQAEDNLSLFQLLLGLFGPGSGSSEPSHGVYVDPNRVRREACASGGPCR